jgi:hypothetical protein
MAKRREFVTAWELFDYKVGKEKIVNENDLTDYDFAYNGDRVVELTFANGNKAILEYKVLHGEFGNIYTTKRYRKIN